jgi:dCTP deaminase
MSILSSGEVKELLKLKPADRNGLVITPLLDPDTAFDADSVDLRLGSHFLLPKTLQQPYFCPDANSATALHTAVYIPIGKYLVVPAHQTILGATLEFLKLPYNVSGQVLTRSSVARTFVVVETAPWIHPEYRGCLTLEIANVSNTPVLLYPGRPICQLILMQVNRQEPSEKLETDYFGPVYPEGPKFDDPETDLAAIGVKRTSVIKRCINTESGLKLEP